jgi:SAM-dependent methyltransferase
MDRWRDRTRPYLGRSCWPEHDPRRGRALGCRPMHEGTAALLRAFVEGYMTDRRNTATRVLHIGDEGLDAICEIFTDPHWTLTTAGQYPAGDLTVQLRRSYQWSELKANQFDVVTSSQALEHFDYPWVTMLELARVLRPGGLACIVASSDRREHLPPIDCWRFNADGLVALVEWADLESLELAIQRNGDSAGQHAETRSDVMVIARRPLVPLHRRLLARIRAGALRRLCIRQARHRADHLEIRRELRRREARRRAWAQKTG